MGYFNVRYYSRVVIYDRRGFIRLATVATSLKNIDWKRAKEKNILRPGIFSFKIKFVAL